MLSLTLAIGIGAFLLIFIKSIMKYLEDLKFSKESSSPGLPLPLIGHPYLLYNVRREDILETGNTSKSQIDLEIQI